MIATVLVFFALTVLVAWDTVETGERSRQREEASIGRPCSWIRQTLGRRHQVRSVGARGLSRVERSRR